MNRFPQKMLAKEHRFKAGRSTSNTAAVIDSSLTNEGPQQDIALASPSLPQGNFIGPRPPPQDKTTTLRPQLRISTRLRLPQDIATTRSISQDTFTIQRQPQGAGKNQDQLSLSGKRTSRSPDLPTDKPIAEKVMFEDDALPAERKDPAPALLENKADTTSSVIPAPPSQLFSR